MKLIALGTFFSIATPICPWLTDFLVFGAEDMGDEIGDHNRRLEIVNRDTDTANFRMKQTNRKIKDRL